LPSAVQAGRFARPIYRNIENESEPRRSRMIAWLAAEKSGGEPLPILFLVAPVWAMRASTIRRCVDSDDCDSNAHIVKNDIGLRAALRSCARRVAKTRLQSMKGICN